MNDDGGGETISSEKLSGQGNGSGPLTRDAARDMKLKSSGVQVRTVREFASCGEPTKVRSKDSQAEPENGGAMRRIK